MGQREAGGLSVRDFGLSELAGETGDVGLSVDLGHVEVERIREGGVLAKLLEATHCLSRHCLLCSFVLPGDCVILPPFYLPQLPYNLSTAT